MPSPASLRLGVLALLAATSVGGCRSVPAPADRSPSLLIGAPEAEEEPRGPAFSEWAADCGEGDAGACHRLFSSLLHAGRLDVARRPETLRGLERGCAQGLGDGCGGAALTHSLLTMEPLESAALERGCALGSSWSCALAFGTREAGLQDPDARAEELRGGITRCREVGDVCFTVAGALDVLPAPAPRVTETPAQLLRLGCTQRDSLSCFTLGRMQFEMQGFTLPADEPAPSGNDAPSLEDAAMAMSAEEARAALTIACEDAIGPACHLLAIQLFRGEGGPADPREARARSRAACMLGTREACDFLAQSHGGRRFPPPEGAEAYPDARTFEAAQRRYCELGGLRACVRLSKVRLHAGRTSPTLAPVDEGLDLLRHACEAGEDRACQDLLSLIGGASAACTSQREPTACLVAGAVLRNGLAVPSSIGETIAPDPERARSFLARACRAGLRAACQEVKSEPHGDSTSD